MLRFFRDIRRNLIVPDNFRKYLLYALGEILLVMIGILLALQVNNWNEERKLNELKTVLLTNLQNDLKIDLEQVIVVRADVSEKDELGMYLMDYFNSNKDVSDYDEDRLKLAFMNALDIQEFSPTRLAYNELVSTGLVNRIKNPALKAFLYDYYETSLRETFDFKQRERYDVDIADGRFAYIPNLTLREKIKSANQMGDWKEDPYEDLSIDWERVRSEEVFPMYLGRLLALHLALISNFDEKEKQIEFMIAEISNELDS